MGCSSSTEEVDIAIVPGAPSQPARHSSGSVKVVPEAEAKMLQTVLPDTKPAPAMSGEESPPRVPPAPAGKAPEDEEAITKQAPCQPGLPANGAGQRAESSAPRAPFPIPEGWRVVCRLSAGDVRSRWGSRPRPAPPGAVGSAAVGLEADLVSPEMSQPLRLPLQLLPQWTEPSVGSDFLGRYEVRGELQARAGSRGHAFEVYDRQDRAQRALQVCQLGRESDVRLFIERLQLESLDPGSRLFLRLRDVALALPGRLAIIEDLPCSTLWDSFERTDPGTDVAAKVATVAKAVLDGLARLHAHGWAHCGVSPRSVCLALDGRWKLTSLESARRVRDMAASVATASPLASTGTAVPPEALFRLPLTDKVDVWQLGVTLCEAVLRKSVHAGCVEADALSAPGHLVALVGFLGPLPDTLVARHPSREDLFTPEGQVLRPATPGGGEQVLEAIEPSPGQSAVDRGPWSNPVAEALSRTGVGDAVPEALDFLALLLHPDPEERPSALEALAHNFLRFAHTPAGQLEDDAKGGDALDKDKSTTAGSSQDEDSEERRHAAKHVTITDGKKEPAGKGEKVEGGITRKGTGFVHVGELPPSDDEDEEEEEQRPAAKAQAKAGSAPEKKVQVQAAAKKGDKTADGTESAGITRKGTGFVHVGELPPSDDEDEEEEQKAKPKTVQIQESASNRASQTNAEEKESKLQRKGTGFVYVGELPPSDDEDEEEEEKAPVPKHKVQIKGTPANKDPDGGPMTRKGTGFVNKSELPTEDDEEDEASQKHAHFQQAPGGAGAKPKEPAKPMRKGTGFVNVSDLPDTDEEDEEESPPPKQPVAGTSKTDGVRFDKAQDAKAAGSGQKSHVKVQRKGTGFVNVGDLPDSEEDEDEEEGDAKKPPQAKAKAQPQKALGGGGVVRKGTGFVHVGELPPSDDEDEEDDKPQAKSSTAAKAVQIQPGAQKDVSGGLTRKGTGYVHAAELPPSDDEEEEEEQPAKKGHVSIQESKEAKKGEPSEEKMTRKGTGFVSKAELPPEDEDDDEDKPRPDKKLQFEEAERDRLAKPKEGGKPIRKGTGFVNVNELPDTDEEED